MTKFLRKLGIITLILAVSPVNAGRQDVLTSEESEERHHSLRAPLLMPTTFLLQPLETDEGEEEPLSPVFQNWLDKNVFFPASPSPIIKRLLGGVAILGGLSTAIPEFKFSFSLLKEEWGDHWAGSAAALALPGSLIVFGLYGSKFHYYLKKIFMSFQDVREPKSQVEKSLFLPQSWKQDFLNTTQYIFLGGFSFFLATGGVWQLKEFLEPFLHEGWIVPGVLLWGSTGAVGYYPLHVIFQYTVNLFQERRFKKEANDSSIKKQTYAIHTYLQKRQNYIRYLNQRDASVLLETLNLQKNSILRLKVLLGLEENLLKDNNTSEQENESRAFFNQRLQKICLGIGGFGVACELIGDFWFSDYFYKPFLEAIHQKDNQDLDSFLSGSQTIVHGFFLTLYAGYGLAKIINITRNFREIWQHDKKTLGIAGLSFTLSNIKNALGCWYMSKVTDHASVPYILGLSAGSETYVTSDFYVADEVIHTYGVGSTPQQQMASQIGSLNSQLFRFSSSHIRELFTFLKSILGEDLQEA